MSIYIKHENNNYSMSLVSVVMILVQIRAKRTTQTMLNFSTDTVVQLLHLLKKKH